MINGVVNTKTNLLHIVYNTLGTVVCSTQQAIKDLIPVGVVDTGDPRMCDLCFDFAAEGGDTEFPPDTPEEQRKRPKRPVKPPKEGPHLPK